MAETKNTLRKIDGELYMQVTPGRAQALVVALDIALSSDELDKRVKGVITAQRELLAAAASGKTIERNPACWVYIAHDISRHGEKLTKIGHARDVDQRVARQTDRPEPMQLVAAWRFASVADAMKNENNARKRYPKYDGGGGTEYIRADANRVLTDLRAVWGDPQHGLSECN